MNVKEQIDYMIQSLQLAKSEIEYAEKYIDTKKRKIKIFISGIIWDVMLDSPMELLSESP